MIMVKSLEVTCLFVKDLKKKTLDNEVKEQKSEFISM